MLYPSKSSLHEDSRKLETLNVSLGNLLVVKEVVRSGVVATATIVPHDPYTG